MLSSCLVDGIDIHTNYKISFHYLYDYDRPSLYRYRGVVSDVIQTCDGNTFLDIMIDRMNGKVQSFKAIFNTKHFIKGSLSYEK